MGLVFENSIKLKIDMASKKFKNFSDFQKVNCLFISLVQRLENWQQIKVNKED